MRKPKKPAARKTKKGSPHGLRVRERNWHYRFKIKGHEYTGNTGLAATPQNANDALRIRAEERQRILSGAKPKPEIYPFSKAAGQFLRWCDGEYSEHPNSALRIRTSFASLQTFFRNEPVPNIHEAQIERFKMWRRSLAIKDVTIRHDLHNLSLFFQYAKKHGWAAENPLWSGEVEIPSDEDAVRMYVLNEYEERAYFAAALRISRDMHDVGRIMILQGCRPEELMAMDQQAVDLAAGSFRVMFGKSAAAKRTLRMRPETLSILEARAGTTTPWMFPSQRKKGCHITKLVNAHNRVCEAIQLTGPVIYDFRHTFATRMALRGCPLPVLAKLLGHSSLRTVMKYIHPDQKNMDEAMDRYAMVDGVDGPSPFRPPSTGDEGKKWGLLG